MPAFSFAILLVASPERSAAFYAGLLDVPIIEQSLTFAMLPLRDGVMLGLWQRDGVEPASTAVPGASELGFTVADAGAVAGLHDQWKARGLRIAQPPTSMDFGTTFVALDPDGHRLRVFAPEVA